MVTPNCLSSTTIDVEQRGARLHDVPPRGVVAVDTVHGRQVDDHPAVVAVDEVLVAVSAATDRNAKALLEGGMNGLEDVVGGRADLNVRGMSDPALVEAPGHVGEAGVEWKHRGHRLGLPQHRFRRGYKGAPNAAIRRTLAADVAGRCGRHRGSRGRPLPAQSSRGAGRRGG